MINNDFIFVHIPKTGGQFIRSICFQNKRKWSFLIEDTHISLKESKSLLQNKLNCNNDDIRLQIPSFAFVRNPWDYYVSRYFFRQRMLKNNEEDQHIVLERFTNDKNGFMDHMYVLAELSEKMEEYTDSLHDLVFTKEGKIASGRTYNFLGIGGWYNNLVNDKISYIGKFENFSQDLIDILLKICPRCFTKEQLQRKLKKPINNSKHDFYKDYYNQELIDMVAKWDEPFIKKFNYDF